MSVDYFVCKCCGETVCDCDENIVFCNCGETWCHIECAKEDGYDKELGTCGWCRGELKTDDEILDYLELNNLIKGNLSRSEVVELMIKDNK